MKEKLVVVPASPERWGDLVELFERRGPRGGHRNSPAYGCWCMYWRDRRIPHGTPKKRRLGALVRAGREPGLLAYEDGTVVGWVSVAPREEFGALLSSPQYRPRDNEAGIWSIVCFTVDRYARDRGVAPALLASAVEYAFTNGGIAVEGYAHASDRDDYMGNVELFREHGFTPVRDTAKRVIMQVRR